MTTHNQVSITDPDLDNEVNMQQSMQSIPRVRDDLSQTRSRIGKLDPMSHKVASRLSHNVRDSSPNRFQQLQSTKAKRNSNGPMDSPDGFVERRSPTKNLFRQNRETVEDMLIRKLRTRHIDNNACFSVVPFEETISNFSTSNPNRTIGPKKHLRNKSMGQGIFKPPNRLMMGTMDKGVRNASINLPRILTAGPEESPRKAD